MMCGDIYLWQPISECVSLMLPSIFRAKVDWIGVPFTFFIEQLWSDVRNKLVHSTLHSYFNRVTRPSISNFSSLETTPSTIYMLLILVGAPSVTALLQHKITFLPPSKYFKWRLKLKGQTIIVCPFSFKRHLKSHFIAQLINNNTLRLATWWLPAPLIHT